MRKPPHLTKKTTDDILRFVTLVRSFLRMEQWNVILMEEPPEDDDVWAEVTPQANHFTVQLRVSKTWNEQSDAAKKVTLIHELLHCLNRDISDVFDDVTFNNTSVSTDAAGMFNQRWTLAEERVVSHLSHILGEAWDQKWPAPESTKVGRGIYVQGDHI